MPHIRHERGLKIRRLQRLFRISNARLCVLCLALGLGMYEYVLNLNRLFNLVLEKSLNRFETLSTLFDNLSIAFFCSERK